MPNLVNTCINHTPADLPYSTKMCTNKHYIINSRGRRILVPCGHCPACLQEKADRRTRKIQNHNFDPNKVWLFFGLTYHNDYIPYIRKSDLANLPLYVADGSMPGIPEGTVCRDVPVYRDFNFDRVHGRRPCGKIDVKTVPFYNTDSTCNFKSLVNGDPDKVSVIYFNDVQLFEKRLRINLQRDGLSDKIDFFNSAEYGGDTGRFHFHVLALVPRVHIERIKTAINSAWPYDLFNADRKHIEIARNAAAYVASYVNCVGIVPDTLSKSVFKPKWSYSKNFGTGSVLFSFLNVAKKIRERNLRYYPSSVSAASGSVDSLLLPRYVINRYFPKFKGYCDLTANEIVGLLQNPARIFNYANRCHLTPEDTHTIRVMLDNKRNMARSFGVSDVEYSHLYVDVWNIYSSNLMVDFYKSQTNPLNTQFAYDNFASFVTGDVKSQSLSSYFANGFPSTILDSNDYPALQGRTKELNIRFHEKNKYFKVTNRVYNLYNYYL